MPLLHSRLIRWCVTKLVNSIEITSPEREAGQQLFLAREGEQSTQREPIISAAFHGDLCHLNLLSPWLWSRFIPQIRRPFQGRGEDSGGEGTEEDWETPGPATSLSQRLTRVHINGWFKISKSTWLQCWRKSEHTEEPCSSTGRRRKQKKIISRDQECLAARLVRGRLWITIRV